MRPYMSGGPHPFPLPGGEGSGRTQGSAPTGGAFAGCRPAEARQAQTGQRRGRLWRPNPLAEAAGEDDGREAESGSGGATSSRMVASGARGILMQAWRATGLCRPDGPSWGAGQPEGNATTVSVMPFGLQCSTWLGMSKRRALQGAPAICGQPTGRTTNRTSAPWRCTACCRLGRTFFGQRCVVDRPRGDGDGVEKSCRNSRISSSQDRSCFDTTGKGGSSDVSWPSHSRYMIAALQEA